LAAFHRAQSLDAKGHRLHAIELLDQALAHDPGHPALAALYANLLTELGDPDRAWPALEAAIRSGGADLPDFWSALASAANAGSAAEPARVFRFHEGYGHCLERLRPGPATLPPSDPDPDRPLRIGIVSYDFKRHSSVSFFLRPLLQHLDRAQFRTTAYHIGLPVDEHTRGFAALVERFRHIPAPAPDPLAAAIRADDIDIAIELIGHTGRRALPAFQPRCAPVQISYLGYPNTTGMPSFDWRLVDSTTDPPVPPRPADELATERLYRLDPCFLTYAPDPDAPPPAPPPSLTARRVAFGSFSTLSKLTDLTLNLYGRILAATPGSRLILKNRAHQIADGATYLRERVARAGLDPARVDLLPMTPSFSDHLRSYSLIDIALDTFPYNGTTTICESLLMGVPLLTMRPGPRHDRHAARVGMSLLATAGAPDLIAPDEAGLVALAAALASDPALLATRRPLLRQALLSSPVCDHAGFARRFGAALRDIWRRSLEPRGDNPPPAR
jgi:protein O-GlcNAc transferase